MKFRKLFFVLGLIVAVSFAFGCSFSEQVQEAGETAQEAKENASGTIPTVIGTTVATATGIPIAAPVISFLVGLGMAIVERKKRKKSEVVAGVMARAIEKSPDKSDIAFKVREVSAAEGVAVETHRIVRSVA